MLNARKSCYARVYFFHEINVFEESTAISLNVQRTKKHLNGIKEIMQILVGFQVQFFSET